MTFIIQINKNFKDFQITKDDIIKALQVLFGTECSINILENILVFDYNEIDDRKLINKSLKFLKTTYSPCTLLGSCNHIIYSEADAEDMIKRFESFFETMRCTYNIKNHMYLKTEKLEMYEYDFAQRSTTTLGKELLKTIQEVYDFHGLLTNYELLERGIGRFIINFNYNLCEYLPDLTNIPNVSNSRSHINFVAYKTKPNTFERFNEILIHALLIVKYTELIKVVGGSLYE